MKCEYFSRIFKWIPHNPATTYIYQPQSVSYIDTKLFWYDRWNIKAAIFHRDMCDCVMCVLVCVYWCGLYLVHLPLNNHNLSNAMQEVEAMNLFLFSSYKCINIRIFHFRLGSFLCTDTYTHRHKLSKENATIVVVPFNPSVNMYVTVLFKRFSKLYHIKHTSVSLILINTRSRISYHSFRFAIHFHVSFWCIIRTTLR